MPDDFGIIGTSIQQLEEMNDSMFSDTENVVKDTEKKEVKKEEEKKEPPKTPSIDEINNELLGEEDADEEPEEVEPPKEKEKEEEFNQFEALSKNLYELGIFDAEIDEEGNPVYQLGSTPEKFKELWEDQKAKALDSSLYNFLMNKHGEEGVNVFKAIFQDGVSPREYFQTYTELQDLDSLNIEDENDQAAIVRESLRQQGWKEDKISQRIQKLKDRAELQEEAEILHPQLVESKQQALLAKQQQLKEAEERKAADELAYKTSVNKLLQEAIQSKELDGISVTPEKAQKLFAYVNNKTYKNTRTGERYSQFDVDLMELKKPENLKKSLKLAALLQDGLDLSSVQKKAISKESNSLFKEFVVKKQKASPAKSSGGWNI